jgi:hypothetical protein
MNFSLTESNNSRSMQVKKAKTKVLKHCVSDAIKNVTMLIIFQQSVREILPSLDGLYCLKRGENGHLASWCAKEDGNQLRIEVSVPLLLVEHAIAKILK